MGQDNNVKKWLRRIFSIQTVSLLIAIFAAYYTYKAYIANRPGELLITFPVLNSSQDEITYIEASEVKRYFSLGFYDIPPVSVNDARIGGPENMLLFPVVSNITDRSLKGFSADIYIWHNENMLKLFEESQTSSVFPFINTTSYDIKSQDNYGLHLSYNKDYLAANRRLPNPINTFMLFMANEKIGTQGGDVAFTYYITYDGLKEPISFQYNARMFYREDEDMDEDTSSFTSDFIINARYNYFKNKVFAQTMNRSEFEDGEWIFIDRNNVYRNIKHLLSDEFMNMKNAVITDLQEK